MTHTIRLLAAAVCIMFATSILVAIRGARIVMERAGHEWEWPGLGELLLILDLLGTTILFFAIILILWLWIALRRLEWAWVISMVLVVVGLVALIVAVVKANRFVLSALGHLTPSSVFLALPLLFIPLLAGIVPPTVYGFLAERGVEPARRDRRQRYIDMTLAVTVLVVVLLGYVAWQLHLGSGIAAVYAAGPLLLAYIMPLCAALGIVIAASAALRAAQSSQSIWAMGLGILTLVAVVAIIVSIVCAEVPIIAIALILSMVVLPLTVLISGIFSRRRRNDGVAAPAPMLA
jgi:hypothetical protein